MRRYGVLGIIWMIVCLYNWPLYGAEHLHTPAQRLQLVEQVEQILTAKGVRVALLARMGRPQAELPPGMRFTHVGFVVAATSSNRDGQTTPRYTTYNMYQQKEQPDTSALVEDSMVDFFANAVELEAGLFIPSPALQERLLAVIQAPLYRAMHDPHYSLIANPYTLGRQNCTEFILDVIHAALYQTDDIQQIKRQEVANFVAQPVHVTAIKLRLAALFTAEIFLSDHTGPPVTATFETISRFLKQHDTQSEGLTLRVE